MQFTNTLKVFVTITLTLLVISLNALIYHQAHLGQENGFDWSFSKSEASIVNTKSISSLDPKHVDIYELSDLSLVLQKYRESEGEHKAVNLTALDMNFLQIAKEYQNLVDLSKEINGIFSLQTKNNNSGYIL